MARLAAAVGANPVGAGAGADGSRTSGGRRRDLDGLAAAGVPRAQTNLGASLALGSGVRQDLAAARLWLRRGAEAGDPLGQRNLATLLLPEDAAEAALWYRLAAEQGDAVGQDQLSRMLFTGEGVPQALAESRDWAERAAGQGSVNAAARLGTMCHEATGGDREPEQAVR